MQQLNSTDASRSIMHTERYVGMSSIYETTPAYEQKSLVQTNLKLGLTCPCGGEASP